MFSRLLKGFFIAVSACVGLIAFAIIVFAAPSEPHMLPTSISLSGGAKFLVDGKPQELAFGGGEEGDDPGQIHFLSEFPFDSYSPECVPDPDDQSGTGNIVCTPRGYYTATVTPEIGANGLEDVFTGFSVVEGSHVLYTRLFPLVRGTGVTAYQVRIIDRTNEAANMEVFLTNQGPKDFEGTITVRIDPPGDGKDILYVYPGFFIEAGKEKAVVGPILVKFDAGNGYYFVTIENGANQDQPLGFDILQSVYYQYLPQIDTTGD